MSRAKKITLIAAVAAMAIVLTAIIRFPITSLPFLKYDPKDVILTTAGFIFGPLVAILAALIEVVVEMVTFSESGPWGALMNIIATLSFSGIAAAIYHKKRTTKGAVLSLVCAVLSLTVVMALWNLVVTPIYTGFPRAEVVKLMPVIIPFNLIKGGVNAALIILLYKPIKSALAGAGLAEDVHTGKNATWNVIKMVSFVILLCLVALIVYMRGGI
ncbi:ECF transporter S component [Peptostreptococcaceae bacterium oral taxon 929]|nr:ECF transporter S component [Peptostreptococcaceae bacterium oral taxon 929]